mgnify:CR=1 FL=1
MLIAGRAGCPRWPGGQDAHSTDLGTDVGWAVHPLDSLADQSPLVSTAHQWIKQWCKSSVHPNLIPDKIFFKHKAITPKITISTTGTITLLIKGLSQLFSMGGISLDTA